MSLWSHMMGRLEVRSETGVAILSKHLSPWYVRGESEEYDGDAVILEDRCISFGGMYRNLGRCLGACVRELYRVGEIERLNVIEWCEDGHEFQCSFHLRDGLPYVTSYGLGDALPLTECLCQEPASDGRGTEGHGGKEVNHER